MIATLTNMGIKLDFPRDSEVYQKILTLSGHILYGLDWYAKVEENNIYCLKEWGFTIDKELQKIIDDNLQKEQEIAKGDIPGILGILRDFQKEAVAFGEMQNGNFLNADDQGLGKTIETLCWIQLHRDLTPVVIITPASLKINWKNESENWLPNPDVEVLKGIKPYQTTKNILILNYDIAYKWTEEIKRRNPKILILDEFTAIKEQKSRRTKAIQKLKNTPHKILLSGTPILNRRKELFVALQLVRPQMFPMLWNLTSLTNEELHRKLRSVMIRRLKQDVLKELPDKSYSFVPMELSNIREYQKAEKDFISWVRSEKGYDAANRIRNVEAMTKVEGLSQLATKGKLKQVIEWISTFLESGQKLVVFCTHTFAIDSLMNEFPSAVKMDGSVPQNKRQGIVDRFQNDEKTNLFIGMLDVQGNPAGVGWTLTASWSVAVVELQWSPEIMRQAFDRVHRLTQKNAVMIYYLLANNTIEERRAKILDRKLKEINAIMNGQNVPVESLLEELMNSYK
jgi:SWI/SNF-related matrix-associated actin-dependent regulator of chromatin subfamily A-like protein 1